MGAPCSPRGVGRIVDGFFIRDFIKGAPARCCSKIRLHATAYSRASITRINFIKHALLGTFGTLRCKRRRHHASLIAGTCGVFSSCLRGKFSRANFFGRMMRCEHGFMRSIRDVHHRSRKMCTLLRFLGCRELRNHGRPR